MSSFQSIDPSNGQTISSFKFAGDKEIDLALLSAEKTYLSFKNFSFHERAELLQKVADELEKNALTYAEIMAKEMGKPISEGEAEVKKCAWVCRYYADNASSFLADEKRETDANLSLVRKDPLGAILAIMPWNFPFWQVFRVAAPTIMAGNVIILKHAMNTPQCALSIEQIFNQSGGNGVLQSLFARHEDVEKIISHKVIKGVTLTGSNQAGIAVAQIAARHLKPYVLELGGSDPFIVFSDADIEDASAAGIKSRCSNSGQSCIAAKRFIIHDQIFDEFLDKFSEKMKNLVVGSPLDKNTSVGPLANKAQQSRLHEQVLDAKEKGAKILCGGELPKGPGCFYPPTIITQINPRMRIWSEEVFGPVATFIPFSDEQEAISLANDTPYGLGASVWTKDQNRMNKLPSELDCGMVFINEIVKSDPRLPFGGIKESGHGRELGQEGIISFVNVKTIWINS